MKWITDDDFHAQMDADPKAVYVVELYDGTDRQQTALFSTKANAEAWLARPEFEDATAVVCPFVIDEPEFRNGRAS